MAQHAVPSNMNVEQLALIALQQELTQTRQLVERVSGAHDALRAAHDATNVAAQQALAEQEQKMRAITASGR